MKVIYSAAIICLACSQINAQSKPEKKLEIIPRGELRFFNGDSLKVSDSLRIRIPNTLQRYAQMPEYKADPNIDYKIRIYRPDSTIDYKILRKRF